MQLVNGVLMLVDNSKKLKHCGTPFINLTSLVPSLAAGEFRLLIKMAKQANKANGIILDLANNQGINNG